MIKLALILLCLIIHSAQAFNERITQNKERRKARLQQKRAQHSQSLSEESPYYSDRSLGGYREWQNNAEGDEWYYDEDGGLNYYRGDFQSQYVSADQMEGWIENSSGSTQHWQQNEEGLFEMEDEDGNRWTINFNEGTSENYWADGSWARQFEGEEEEGGEDSLGFNWLTDKEGIGYLRNPEGETVVEWTKESDGSIRTTKSSGESSLEKTEDGKNEGWIKIEEEWKYEWSCDSNGDCNASDSEGNKWFQDGDGSEYVYYFDGSVYFYDGVRYVINYFDNIFWYRFNFNTWEFKKHRSVPKNFIPYEERNA